jgi:cytochrome c
MLQMRKPGLLACLFLLVWCAVDSGETYAQERGAALFEPCRACHALDPKAQPMAGPNLAGLLGRRVAGDPEFDYSPVLREAGAAGQTWTEGLLDRFLADPEAMFPGLWMSMRGIANPDDRRALIDFMAKAGMR